VAKWQGESHFETVTALLDRNCFGFVTWSLCYFEIPFHNKWQGGKVAKWQGEFHFETVTDLPDRNCFGFVTLSPCHLVTLSL
jgi:hypothetical protein